MQYARAEVISIKADPTLGEKWVQGIIAQDPALLGLGELVLKDAERVQPKGGRLDLLFQDPDLTRRYEVEIQLGRTDESHIIRTIEYWDIERKRYPQYEHTAVIVAEDITSRFLNVIGLFNGAIPLVAIQMSALRVGQLTTLTFTKVLDQRTLGFNDDEEIAYEPATRAYWIEHTSEKVMAAAEQLASVLGEVDPGMEPKYNKFYIGFANGGVVDNYVILKPQKNHIVVRVKLPDSDEWRQRIEAAGLDLATYEERAGRYRLRLEPAEVEGAIALLREMFAAAKGDD